MPLHERDAAVGVRHAPRMYPPELQPMIQDTLHTLANIDFEHETDVTRLIESAMSPAHQMAGVPSAVTACEQLSAAQPACPWTEPW